MKKLSIIFAALLFCVVGHAQQALWGGSRVVSPELHEDNTVTFRLAAPNATKVQVTGDFLPTEKIEIAPGRMWDAPVPADLVKNDDGVWEYTTPVLSPELYSYSFIVDGITIHDPSNVYMNRDVASVTNIFIIGGNRADLYKVQNVPHGSVARVWYDSETLGYSRRLTIYTPAGYADSNEEYPVFYLLHGAGGDEEAWIALGRTAQIMDNLIAQGRAKPMIVVMTNGNPGMKAAPGESPDGMYVPSMMQRVQMPAGSFEAAFPDVINYIESHYRVIKEKSSRAIAGLSMGGGHSFRISLNYPDTFDYVGIFSASGNITEGDSPMYQNVEAKLAAQFEKKPALYWIGMGKTDGIWPSCKEYREYLDSKEYPYTYYESEGGHIWRNWRIYLTEFAPLLFR